ncbi:hypothetical protein AM2010_1686 [Pelagerythrobacter marensis]|uniref:Hemolysin activation/secretion protein n=1 Tax=Pelagerythrobacter marensis TaxID=543877 RepID=A0A0G3X979_9SPHN|nr:ShlB/FhaC/HecB family hemolysin secretion/activation protein [Pelagerythrobacter marensis]AKM07752.1 hypothetical protein AM2010_1686 [Pelagerythrobacter marensis]
MQLRLACCASAAALSVSFVPVLHAQDTPEPVETAEPAAREQTASPDPAARRVDILNYAVSGNTLLSTVEVQRALQPYLGPARPLADVDAAREALMNAFHAKGYETVNVIIPEQQVANGNIRLEVVEMRVGRLRVEGATYYSPDDIRARMPSVKEGEVPNYNELSQELAGVNRSRDRMVSPTVRAGLEPGTVDIDLTVEDSLPLHGSIELNDRASSSTERLKVSASATYGNLFQADHSLSIQGQFSPEAPEESWAVSASYAAPIKGTPLTLVAYGVHTDSDVAALGGINVLGSGDIVGLRAIYSAVAGDPAAPTVHQFTAGLDYKKFTESLLSDDNPSYTPIDYVPLMLRYDVSERRAAYDFDLGLGVAFGLRGLAADDIEFGLKRYNANANWLALRGDLSYIRKLPGDWRVGGGFAWQYAGEPLISNEQFSIGGFDSVRGYYESYKIGDDGLSGQFEVHSPNFAGTGSFLRELRLFGFADGGFIRIYDPLSVQEINGALASVGGGVNVSAVHGLNGAVTVARPFLEEGGTLTDFDSALRIQFRVWKAF